MATLTVINNPFNPNEKTVTQIDGGLAIFHYINVQDEDIEYVASLNGQITENFSHILRQDDSLAVVPIPKGGGGNNKGIFKLVAMVALAVVAPYAASWVIGATGMAVGPVGFYMIQGAIMVGGGLLINSLIPSPELPSYSSKLEEVSPTYSFSGGSNAREAGTTIPIMLGKARVVPPVIGSYLSLEGDKQYLNVLMAVNDGQVDSITDIEVNNQSIENFDNISYETRLGTNEQTLIDGFRNSKTTVNVSVGLNTQNGDTVYTTAGNAVDEIEVVLSLPRGHFRVNDDGGYVMPKAPITYKIEYKLATEETYTEFITESIGNVYKTTQRISIRIPYLQQGQYDVRVTRTSVYSEDTRVSNDMILEYVNEVVYEKYIYPNVSLLAVRAMATDQLNGSFPTITALVDNTLTRDINKPKTNPAWACYDLLKREGIPDTDINLVKFQEWADYCDTEGFTCNLYLDTQQELQNALNMVSLLGRASVVQFGSVFTPIVNKVVDIPTQSFLFTSANIKDNTFQLDYIPYNDRSNVVEITYYDKDDSYKPKTVQTQSHDFDTTSTEIKSSINLYGCTDREIALRYGKFLLNQNRYLSETITFEADIDSIAATVGDVIKAGVKYMSNTIADGRLKAVDGNIITLDQEVELEAGKDYELQIRTEDDNIYIFDYTSNINQTTDTITFSNVPNIENPKNVVFAFGFQDTEATNLYRITSITRASDFTRKISALEYNPSVYDDNATVEVEQVLNLNQINNLRATSGAEKDVSGAVNHYIKIYWEDGKLQENVYIDGKFMGIGYGGEFQFNNPIDNRSYTISVGGLEIEYFYNKTNTYPNKVENITYNSSNGNLTVSWSASSEINFKHYEIYLLGQKYTTPVNTITFYDMLVATYSVDIYVINSINQSSEKATINATVNDLSLSQRIKDGANLEKAFNDGLMTIWFGDEPTEATDYDIWNIPMSSLTLSDFTYASQELEYLTWADFDSSVTYKYYKNGAWYLCDANQLILLNKLLKFVNYQAISDGNVRVFSKQPAETQRYDIGDLWIRSDGILMQCINGNF